MALNNSDLFLVSQREDSGAYTDRKIKYITLKNEMGVGLAEQEKTNPITGVPFGVAGMMYPDASLGYDKNTGKLYLPLDARGVTFAGVINSDNVDSLPLGDENAGDFYICTEAELDISTLTWLGVSETPYSVVINPDDQVIESGKGGSGYSPNNGFVTTIGLKQTGVNNTDVGNITLEIVNGKVISATHEANDLHDIPSLNLVGGIFEFGDTSGFAHDEPALAEVVSVVTISGEHLITFEIINQGSGYRLYNEGGTLSGALAIPAIGSAAKNFEVDVTVNPLGQVTDIIGVRIEPGFSNGDELAIKMPYRDNPSVAATFTLVMDNEGTRTIQINDKLIKQSNGEWTVLIDALAEQAILSITNEEGDIGDGENGNLTPALVIKQVDDDPKYVTMRIDNVATDMPGLMPPELFDQLTGYPDLVAGGTVIDVDVKPMISDDLDEGGNSVESIEINPLISNDVPFDEDVDLSVAKNVILDIKLAGTVPAGVGAVRSPGVVYIANEDELKDQIGNFSSPSGDYYKVLNVNEAGYHLMPRDIEQLQERDEVYRTAKRLNLSTDKYYVTGDDETSFTDITATLTYEDGGNTTTNANYTYEWSGTEYPNGTTKIVGDTATLRVTGLEFSGPTEITCTATEVVGTDEEFQTLEDSVYIHFGGGESGPIDPPTDKPTLGQLTLIGENNVVLEEDNMHNRENYIATLTGGTATDVVFEFSSSDETIAKHIGTRVDVSESATFEFIAEGSTKIGVVVSSASAEDTNSAYIDVECNSLVTQLPDLQLRSYDFDNDTFMTKIEHILSEGQYDSEITYTLECDDPTVTITPIETGRVASTEHTFQVTVPSKGTYTFNGTAYPTGHPDRVVTDSIDVTWVEPGSNTPSGSFIHFKAFCNKDEGTSKVKVTVSPAAAFKKFNFESGLYEDLGSQTVQLIDHGGVKNGYTEWWINSTDITHFKWETINGIGDWPEIEFDYASTTPSLTSLKGSFDLFKQTGERTLFKLGWIDTSQVTDMQQIFESCKLYHNDLDINGWDVSKVTTLRHMCNYGMVRADIRNWDISSVTDMTRAFQGAGQTATTQYWTPENSATYWDFSNVTNMFGCWYSTNNIWNNKWNAEVVQDWKMSNVTNVTQMFNYGYMSDSNLYPKAYSTQFNLWCAEKMDHNNTLYADGHHKWWTTTPDNRVPTTQMPQWLQPCTP